VYKLSDFYEGREITIKAVVKILEDDKEVVMVMDFIEKLQRDIQARVVAFIKKIGDRGFPRNRDKMSKLQSYEFFELRIFTKPQVRIFCIPNFEEKELILIDGELKKDRKIKKARLLRIQRIWDSLKREV